MILSHFSSGYTAWKTRAVSAHYSILQYKWPKNHIEARFCPGGLVQSEYPIDAEATGESED